MTIILDMGGVLMQHNMQGCKARFRELLGEETMARVLGLADNAEGVAHSLMERFEAGNISTDAFLSTLLSYARPGTTTDDLRQAWNLMHGGIPAERLALIRQWHDQGHRLFLLSNNNALHWQDVFGKYDLSVFEHCFASHLLHSCKPEPRIFEIANDYLHTNHLPEPYYFVDDLEANRLAAQAFGWLTFPDLESLEKVLNPKQ